MKKKKAVKLFLDSGAFSSWSKGSEINIKDYIEFIKEYEEFLDVYAVLDSIGDPEKTLKNQKVMEKAGLTPLPCFHYGEPEKYLIHYLENYDYIALGGMVPISTPNLIGWLDRIFKDYLCGKDGMPKVKVHGFGMTSIDLMFRYPWYSVDSTSWVMTSRFGSIYVPKYRQGKFIYNEIPWKVAVSNRSPDMKEQGKHITSFSHLEQEIILDYIHAKGYKMGESKYKKVDSPKYLLKKGERWFGKEEADSQRSIHGEERKNSFVKTGWGKDLIVETVIDPGIANDYSQRDVMNILYYLDLEKEFPKWPWPLQVDTKMKGFGLT